jgi:replication factor C small subunit
VSLAEAEEIWVEKYRPKKLAEIVGQDEIVSRLQSFVGKKSLPHLLFSGPPGCGKTTAALCISRELFGEGWRQNFLELNASDERGIDTIRTKVKDYARTRPIGDVPYKLVLLDESDALTSDAQHALRRTMEIYTHTCRFILDCNYSSRIIEPIQSRCAIFRFRRLNEDDIGLYLKRIARAEKLTLTVDGIKAIAYVSEGDMRRATNILQSASTLRRKVEEKAVYEVSAVARPEEVRQMLELALDGRFEEARSKLYNLLINQGLAGEDILDQVHREIFNLKIPEPVKVKLIDKVGEFDYRLTEGASERIQLEAALAHFVLIGDRLKL